MRIYYLLLIIIISIQHVSSSNRIIYLEPGPGAKLVSTENNLIIGFEKEISCPDYEIAGCIKADGSKSFIHTAKIIITIDKKKIIFKPANPFMPGEQVTVSITGKLAGEFTNKLHFSYTFQTSLVKPAEENESLSYEIDNIKNQSNIYYADLPPVLPVLTVTINNNPASGYIFLSNYRLTPNPPFTPYLIITDKNGLPFYYVQMSAQCMDFKKQPNGNLTYFDRGRKKFYELGTNYNIIDSFYCGNGYLTDEHELRLLNNGHALLMSYDKQVINMSLIVNGGDTAANVTGLIIQEIDANKNVVFQWRSWDHFLITDALHENLLSNNIDAVHGNAIELDNDGNLMISSRHLDEITKINRTTGAIIWRLGGLKNQYTFINDPIRFTYQHAIRRISNGHITLYDNGNFHTPKFSRAVEYSLDEINRTATLVWEYRHTPSIYGMAFGYAQRLPNGNTLISWGAANPTVTEVTPQGTIAFEMTLPAGMYSYRVLKDDWNGQPTSIENGNNKYPDRFNLCQNNPNPFNPVTNIRFSVPILSTVKISIFDILGREIITLIDDEIKPGTYEIKWNAAKYSSGVYYYKLISGNYTESRKMVLIK